MGTWLNTNQWWDGTKNVTWATDSNAIIGNAIIGNGGAGGAITVGAVSAGTIQLNNFTGTYTLQGTGNTLTQSGGITIGASAGNVTIRGTAVSPNNFTLGGAGGITMNGSGVLVMRENLVQSYTGQTTINSGVVMVNGGSKSTGNFNLNGGLVTDYFQQTGIFSGGLGTGTNQIQIHGNSGFGAGNGTSTWRIGTAGSILLWGSTHFDATTLKFMTAADNLGPTIFGTASLDNGLDLGAATRTIDVFNASTPPPATSGGRIAGVISNGSLIKTGGGNLILANAANTYAGTTTISGGLLTVAATGALGNGSATNTLIFDGGTLRASAAFNSVALRGVTMTSTGITITARDAANATATSFTGTVTFGGTGGFTGTSASFTNGVLTNVSVTPTVAGSNLTFTVDNGAGKTGSTTIATIQTHYQLWAVGGVAFDADTNGDGVKNGMAWLLGAENSSGNASGLLPKASINGTNLRLTFRCLKSTARGGVVLKVQSSADLGASDPWSSHQAAVPDADNTVNGVVFDTTDDGDFINVIADIPAAGAKVFGRLQATP